jgi:hypothetical protein
MEKQQSAPPEAPKEEKATETGEIICRTCGKKEACGRHRCDYPGAGA